MEGNKVVSNNTCHMHVPLAYGFFQSLELLPLAAIMMETHGNVRYYPLRNKTSSFDPASLIMIIPFYLMHGVYKCVSVDCLLTREISAVFP